jgi:hypothetical protein
MKCKSNYFSSFNQLKLTSIRQTILNQIEISNNFIEKFTLKEEEIAVLGEFEDNEEETSGRQTDELNWKFFKAFNKMEQIRRDALELLVKEGHPIG